jgi:diguanylate cyclase (GGDEF)-like protein
MEAGMSGFEKDISNMQTIKMIAFKDFSPMTLRVAIIGAVVISGGFMDAAAAVAMSLLAGFGIIHGMAACARLVDRRLSREVDNRLRRMALLDPLTSLPNRTHLVERLTTEIEEKRSGKIAVISVDLDRFKEINDIRGYSVGNEALKTVASRLAACAPDCDFAARTGGDGFTFFKHVESASEAAEVAHRIRRRMFDPIAVEGADEVMVDGSFGIALFPHHDRTADGLITKSELAAYRAKSMATETSVVYDATMDEAVRERRRIASELRSAIAGGQFELHYQAQESLSTDGVIGHEALLRWRHTERGLIPPNDFIPIAEDTKLIIPIGEWVLRQACRDAVAHPELGRVAVNMSPIQFAQPNLLEMIGAILTETGLDPQRLEIELTESTLMADAKRNLAILADIQKLGVSIAMDDFGTGYSSLSTLRSFQFDKIKMDRSFMPEVESDPQAKAIIRAVLALGRSLGIPILAEGVETHGQLDFLRKEGCSEAQGYLLGRPERLSHAVRKLDAPQTVAA